MREQTDQESQRELPLPFPELAEDMPLLPARMVNEYAYCPRLAYLEWVQGEWADSSDTVSGRHTHRRVDQSGGRLPAAQELDPNDRIHARSITLSSNRLGLIAKLDLIENSDTDVVPVDYKQGKRPHVAGGAYEPERVQLCVQALLLEEHGYQCPSGVLYFAGSRERVTVTFDDELRELTARMINGLRLTASGGEMPPPLEDSPKCTRCSLVSICLPDEVNYLQRREADTPRPLAVAQEEAVPVYVQAHRARIGKSGETLKISLDDETQQTARITETSQLVILGRASITTPALHEMMWREIPVTWHSYGGWFLGHTVGTGHKNVELRTAQYRTSFNDQQCRQIARGIITAKITNARTLLRRNWRGEEAPDELLKALKQDGAKARRAKDLQTLLGIEGTAANRYFQALPQTLRRDDDGDGFRFDFQGRNRRPPPDPVNALLSFAYSLLVRAWTVTLTAVGFDAYRGFYHQPRYGRPALSLDLMEPFRPLIADSTVLQAINNREIRPTDFIAAAGSVNLTSDGRKRFIAAFERRLDQEVTHPLFGYKLSYRRLLELQARLLGRYVMGELDDYPNFTTR